VRLRCADRKSAKQDNTQTRDDPPVHPVAVTDNC
jgi:hypothetical protein